MGLGSAMAAACKPSGIHYNWSLPGCASEYFDLIRNFRRHGWLILYLFGASPALCSSFVEGRDHGLQPFMGKQPAPPACHLLRMGPLGYQAMPRPASARATTACAAMPTSLQDALTRGPIPPTRPSASARRGRLCPTLHQPAANRERVLRHHPRQAHHPQRRAPAARAARARVEYVEGVRLMDLDPSSPSASAPRPSVFSTSFLLHCLHAEAARHATRGSTPTAATSTAWP